MNNSRIPLGDTGLELMAFVGAIDGRNVHSQAVTLIDQNGAPFNAANPLQIGAVTIAAPTGWLASVVSVTTTAAQLPAGQAGRKTIALKAFNDGSTALIYIGHDNTVAAGVASWPLAAGESLELDISPSVPVWVRSSVGTRMLHVAEVYG